MPQKGSTLERNNLLPWDKAPIEKDRKHILELPPMQVCCAYLNGNTTKYSHRDLHVLVVEKVNEFYSGNICENCILLATD